MNYGIDQAHLTYSDALFYWRKIENENSKCKEMCFRADGSHDGAHFLRNFDTGLCG